MKFSIKGFFSKCDQICRKLRIWLHLMKKSLMGNSICCAVLDTSFPISLNLTDFNAVFLKNLFVTPINSGTA